MKEKWAIYAALFEARLKVNSGDHGVFLVGQKISYAGEQAAILFIVPPRPLTSVCRLSRCASGALRDLVRGGVRGRDS